MPAHSPARSGQIGQNSPQSPVSKTKTGAATRFYKLFRASRMNLKRVPFHRYIGLTTILSFFASVIVSVFTSFETYLDKTILWGGLSFCGVMQAVTASYYFRHETPKKRDPGYMSMGDVGRLSWFFVCENIFYSLLLFFQTLFYHPSWAVAEPKGPQSLFSTTMGWIRFALEILFVFIPYWWRPFFPKTALRDSTKNKKKNCKASNLEFYTKNTLVVKCFYNFAKHYIGFFLNYIRFLDRVVMYSFPHKVVYDLEILSTYMSTGGIFLHTLVFKKILTNKQGAMLYQAGYPVTFYLYYKMFSTLILPNLDLALCATVGMLFNLQNVRNFHRYQATLAIFLFSWRKCFNGASGSMFDTNNWVFYFDKIQEKATNSPTESSIVFVALVIFIAFCPIFSRIAKACNPFYPLAKKLHKERPHKEDDSNIGPSEFLVT